MIYGYPGGAIMPVYDELYQITRKKGMLMMREDAMLKAINGEIPFAELEKQKEKERRQRAECNIHVKGNDMFAESSHADLYAAVDELTDKLDRQVGRYKTKTQDHHHIAPKRQA